MDKYGANFVSSSLKYGMIKDCQAKFEMRLPVAGLVVIIDCATFQSRVSQFSLFGAVT